jgi:hypothetical protein
MLIVHGTKRKVRFLGWVADFCPICRRPRAFKISRIGLASHIYFISFGEGKLAGHIIECDECRTRMVSDESRYATISKPKSVDFAALAAATMPDLPERLGERLLVEKQIAEEPHVIDAHVRKNLILEPFGILEVVLVEATKDGTHMDKPSTIGCLGTILVAAGMGVGAMYVPRQWQDAFFLTLLVLMGIGTIYTLVQMGFVPRRFVRSQVLPRLARSLRPLQPSEEELADAITRCKQSRLSVGKKVKLAALWRQISVAE